MANIRIQAHEIRNRKEWEANGQVCFTVGELDNGSTVQELRSTETGKVLEVTVIEPFDAEKFWKAVADHQMVKFGKVVDPAELQAKASAARAKSKRR